MLPPFACGLIVSRSQQTRRFISERRVLYFAYSDNLLLYLSPFRTHRVRSASISFWQYRGARQ